MKLLYFLAVATLVAIVNAKATPKGPAGGKPKAIPHGKAKPKGVITTKQGSREIYWFTCHSWIAEVHAHPLDCSMYIVCNERRAYEFDCAWGLYFNDELKTCVEHWFANCAPATGLTGTTMEWTEWTEEIGHTEATDPWWPPWEATGHTEVPTTEVYTHTTERPWDPWWPERTTGATETAGTTEWYEHTTELGTETTWGHTDDPWNPWGHGTETVQTENTEYPWGTEWPTTDHPKAGEHCDPATCKNIGHCQSYLRCDKKSQRWVHEECGHGMFWDPKNGGNCVSLHNLGRELEQKYRKDPECLACFWKPVSECSARYLYQAPDMNNRHVQTLSCADNMIFSEEKKTCQPCHNVKRKNGRSCC